MKNCSCTSKNKSGCSTCQPSDDALKNLALTWVVGQADCDRSLVENNVSLWWELFENQSCNSTDLRMLLLARQIAMSLMGVYARQVDTSSMLRTRQMRGSGSMKNEGWMKAQATASGVRFADALNKSEYNDFSNSRMDSGSLRQRGSSNYANSGSFANSISRAGASSDSYRRSQGEGVRRDNSTFNRNILGAGKSESHSDAQGNQGNFFSGFGAIGIGVTNTSGFVGGQGQSNGFAFNARNDGQTSFGTVNGFTTSIGSSGMVSNSFGNSTATSGASGTSGSGMNDDGSAFRTSGSHGEGLGTGQGGSNAQSRSSTQGSSDSKGVGFSEFNSEGSGVIIGNSAKANQRFKHLQSMVDSFTSSIKELRKYKASNQPAQIGAGKAPCASPQLGICNSCCNDEISGAFLNEYKKIGCSGCGI